MNDIQLFRAVLVQREFQKNKTLVENADLPYYQAKTMTGHKGRFEKTGGRPQSGIERQIPGVVGTSREGVPTNLTNPRIDQWHLQDIFKGHFDPTKERQQVFGHIITHTGHDGDFGSLYSVFRENGTELNSARALYNAFQKQQMTEAFGLFGRSSGKGRSLDGQETETITDSHRSSEGGHDFHASTTLHVDHQNPNARSSGGESASEGHPGYSDVTVGDRDGPHTSFHVELDEFGGGTVTGYKIHREHPLHSQGDGLNQLADEARRVAEKGWHAHPENDSYTSGSI